MHNDTDDTMSKICIFVGGILPNNQFIVLKEEALLLDSVNKVENAIFSEFPHLEKKRLVFYYKGNLLIILIYFKLKSKIHVRKKNCFIQFSVRINNLFPSIFPTFIDTIFYF